MLHSSSFLTLAYIYEKYQSSKNCFKHEFLQHRCKISFAFGVKKKFNHLNLKGENHA